VVENASGDRALETIADLPVTTIEAGRNGGFSYGCNLGVAAGSAPYVLLLNPDAQLGTADLQALVAVLDRDPGVAIVGPKLYETSDAVAPSQRRFPTAATTWGQALLLHRVWPALDELIHDPAAYAAPAEPDWISGACMLVRRSALEAIGGMDEGFFLYCEDTDVCRRLRDAGHRVAYEPAAVARHVGGASGDRGALRPVLATSRVRYARKHGGRIAAAVERAGIAVGEALHAMLTLPRRERSRGHLAALRAVAGREAGA